MHKDRKPSNKRVKLNATLEFVPSVTETPSGRQYDPEETRNGLIRGVERGIVPKEFDPRCDEFRPFGLRPGDGLGDLASLRHSL